MKYEMQCSGSYFISIINDLIQRNKKERQAHSETLFQHKKHFIFQEQIQQIHHHRAPCGNCHHRNSRRHASSGPECSAGKSACNHMFGQPQAVWTHAGILHKRQRRLDAETVREPGKRCSAQLAANTGHARLRSEKRDGNTLERSRSV